MKFELSASSYNIKPYLKLLHKAGYTIKTHGDGRCWLTINELNDLLKILDICKEENMIINCDATEKYSIEIYDDYRE